LIIISCGKRAKRKSWNAVCNKFPCDNRRPLTTLYQCNKFLYTFLFIIHTHTHTYIINCVRRKLIFILKLYIYIYQNTNLIQSKVLNQAIDIKIKVNGINILIKYYSCIYNSSIMHFTMLQYKSHGLFFNLKFT